MSRLRRCLLGLLIVIALAILGVCLALPAYVESRVNRVRNSDPIQPSAKATELHQSLPAVVDLHADSSLWGRNLVRRSERGHVDLPRLRSGNVGVQMFTVVTKVPRWVMQPRSGGESDLVTPLAIAQLWPVQAWWSLKHRALYQARMIRALDWRDDVMLIDSRSALEEVVRRRTAGDKVLGVMIGLEGAHALEGDLGNLKALHDAGFRMIAPTHFFDTEVGGSASGRNPAGLSELGRQWLTAMNESGMLIDAAHASPATINEIASLTKQPIVASHSGVRGTCDNGRNLADAQLRAIAKTGGVVGIGYWETAVCGESARAVARAIRYTANLIGVEHVALGSDWDGATTVPFDAAALPQLTQALLDEGFSPAEVRLIMGENTLRVLRQVLP